MNRLWNPGDKIERWLVLERFLGGFGVVYVLRDLRHEKDSVRPAIMAAKTVRPEWASDSNRLEQFEQEAYRWLSLGIHKHIVRLYTVDRIHGQAVAFAEYIPRGPLPNTLRGWIEAGILEFECALRFGAHICRALDHAHSLGLNAHMDLKPENIMITANGVAKVTDWGLSRGQPMHHASVPSLADLPFRPATKDHLSQSAYGTPGYAAPELSRSSKEPSRAADMFSLGVILTEMFGGIRPASDTPVENIAQTFGGLIPSTAPNLAGRIAACLRSSPNARPEIMAPIETAITEAFCEITGLPLEPPPARSWETGADVGQRAYALMMLGRTDEATALQAGLVTGIAHSRNEPVGSESALREPVIMMDYKEEGWRFVVPQSVVTESEAKLASNPHDIELLSKAALMNGMAGSEDRALTLYSRLIELEPDRVEWLAQKCRILEDQERWGEALTCHDRIIDLRPADATSWLDLAKCNEKLGDIKKAAEAAAQAVAQAVTNYPRSEEAYNTYGHCLEQLGDYREAIEAFEGALRVNPESAVALYNIGTCYIKLNSPRLAFKNLLAAVEKDPEFAEALNSLSSICVQTRSFQEALTFLERAIAAKPHYARPWFNKGQVYEAIHKLENAREAYLTALSIDPNYELARTALDNLEARLA